MAISLIDFKNQTQTPMMKGIVQEVTNESVFLKRLNFVQVDGFAYRYNRQKTLGGIAFRELNSSYTPDTGVVNPQMETLSIFGGEVRTDRQLVNKQGDVARSNLIAAKVKKAGLFFDKYVIGGDPSLDPKQFYGLNGRLTGNQVIIAGTNGGALTLAMLDQALDTVVGTNDQKLIVCNKYIRRQITNLLRAAASGSSMSEVGKDSTGAQVRSYDGATIEVLDEDGDESPILPLTESQGSSNVTTSLYIMRLGSSTDGEYVQGLIGAQMIEHVAVGLLGTYYSDIVESNMGLGVFHPRAACRVKGLT